MGWGAALPTPEGRIAESSLSLEAARHRPTARTQQAHRESTYEDITTTRHGRVRPCDHVVHGDRQRYGGLGVAAAPGTAAARSVVKAPTKVLVIVEENHSLPQMLAGMPYLSRLATKRYGYAARYLAITHPSLPNYLAIAGGSTFGVTNDAGPATNGRKVGKARSVFDEAIAHGQDSQDLCRVDARQLCISRRRVSTP